MAQAFPIATVRDPGESQILFDLPPSLLSDWADVGSTLQAAAARLRVAPERCVYVGDAERDITAGIAAGMRTIIARYGYIEPHEAPGTWPADGGIDRPGALLGWLPERRAAS